MKARLLTVFSLVAIVASTGIVTGAYIERLMCAHDPYTPTNAVSFGPGGDTNIAYLRARNQIARERLVSDQKHLKAFRDDFLEDAGGEDYERFWLEQEFMCLTNCIETYYWTIGRVSDESWRRLQDKMQRKRSGEQTNSITEPLGEGSQDKKQHMGNDKSGDAGEMKAAPGDKDQGSVERTATNTPAEKEGKR